MRCVELQRAPSPHERCNSCSAVRPILRTPLALSPANIPRCTMPLCRTDSLPAPPVFSFAANAPHRHWLVSGPSTFPANTFQHIRCQFVRFERPERAPLPGNGNMKRKIQYDLLCSLNLLLVQPERAPLATLLPALNSGLPFSFLIFRNSIHFIITPGCSRFVQTMFSERTRRNF